MMSFEAWRQRYGPWAVVTGASQGIGKAFAEGLAERGVNLLLVARRKPLLDRLAQDLEVRHRIQVVPITLDLAESDASRRLFEACGDLDIGLLVANAGFGASGDFLKSDLDQERALLQVNAAAVLEQCHLFGRRFAKRGRGGIILLSSIVSFQGVPNMASYAASKAHVQSLAEGLRPEFKTAGIDLLSIAPGPVDTGFAERANLHFGPADKASAIGSAGLKALGKRTTLRPGRLGRVLHLGLGLLPRSLRTLVLGRIMGRAAKGGNAGAIADA